MKMKKKQKAKTKLLMSSIGLKNNQKWLKKVKEMFVLAIK